MPSSTHDMDYGSCLVPSQLHCLYVSLTLWRLVQRRPLSRLELQFLLMFVPYPLQYPKVVQKVQDRGDDSAGCCSAYRNLGRDGESTAMLRVDVDERGEQPGYGIEESDSVTAIISE